MLVGLQGSGKTTTAGKLAVQSRKMGHKPLLVAADPYRPAAVAQLQTLGKQIDVPVFHDPNKKPPELAQAAVKHAEQNGLSFVVLDTAGRLQINEELMRELESITSKVSPDEILLVADAMTGQEAVRVAEGFLSHVPLTGVILTKLDGDARGGAALSLREVTGVPIKYVGTGEKLDALEQFHPDRLAQRIAGGSGTSPAEINQLLSQFRQMQALMKQFSKGMPGMKGLGGGLPSLPSLPSLGNGAPAALSMPTVGSGAGSSSNRQHHKQRK